MQNSGHSDSYSFYGKPYNFFGDYLREKYGFRVFKLPVNAGLGCPNRINGNGCIFCSENGSASPASGKINTITQQMIHARESFVRTDIQTKYIAYFQAYTNTFAEIDTLRKLYDTAVSFPDVMGLMIGTRPDCVSEETVELIQNYNRDGFELWVEIGMQSAHEKSLQYLHRHHTYAETVRAVNLLSEYAVNTCVHLILGIPGESWEDMMETAEKTADLPIHGVKIHHLHVLKNTELHNLYQAGRVPVLNLTQYVSLFCDFVERLPKHLLIHRISGDALEDEIIAPKWGLEKGTVQKSIEEEFHKRGTWQGFLYDD